MAWCGEQTLLRDIERRIGKTFATTTFVEADDVLQVQDDLYRRFKAKYDKSCYGITADTCVELNDYLTAERVQLLYAIKEGDIDGIRALTNIDWNFVYPPAVINATSGERSLEAWCRSPLCLLVRPDEATFSRSSRRRTSLNRSGRS